MPRRKAPAPEPEQPREHRLTAADVLSITGVESTFGTARFLPSEDIITEVVRTLPSYDPYMKIIEAMYVGDEPPEFDIIFNEGFPDTEDFAQAMYVFLMAHLIYIEVDSEARILGLTYLLKQIITITEPT